MCPVVLIYCRIQIFFCHFESNVNCVLWDHVFIWVWVIYLFIPRHFMPGHFNGQFSLDSWCLMSFATLWPILRKLVQKFQKVWFGLHRKSLHAEMVKWRDTPTKQALHKWGYFKWRHQNLKMLLRSWLDTIPFTFWENFKMRCHTLL